VDLHVARKTCRFQRSGSIPCDPLDHIVDLGFVIEFQDCSRAGIVERVIARKVNQ